MLHYYLTQHKGYSYKIQVIFIKVLTFNINNILWLLIVEIWQP